ncbi:hypothetical protein H6F71_09915 [Microcoleus sp. FACHB-61]|nr:hypothetical protein [Microcoleus sp. FACHB-61]
MSASSTSIALGSEIRSHTRHNFDKLTPQSRPAQGFCRFIASTPPIANYN